MAATVEPTLRGALPLVGRESQRTDLLNACRDAYNGARIVAFIVGETGSGRSRLLDEVIRDPLLERSLIVRLRLHRGDEERGEHLLREALVDALESRPFLRRSLESLIEQAASLPTGKIALGRALETIARRLHLVIAVDDLDAAGVKALRSIEEVLSVIQGDYMIVATTTSESLEEAMLLTRQIYAEERVIRLERLPPEALRELVERLFGFPPNDDDVAWLMASTLGLPILLREALSSLLRSGCVALHGGAWVPVHPFARSPFLAGDALPSMRRRLEQLPHREREWVAVTAMLGRRAPIDATYALGLPEGWFTAFVDRELIEITGRFIEFSHDLFFEAVIAEARRLNLYAGLRDQLDSLLTSGAIARGVRLPGSTIRAIIETASEHERPGLLMTLVAAATELHQRDECAAAIVYFDEVRRCWAMLTAHIDVGEQLRILQAHSDCLYKAGSVAEQVRVFGDAVELLDGATLPTADIPRAVEMLCSISESQYREKNIEKACDLLDRAQALTECVEPSKRMELLDRIAYHRAWSLKSMDRHAEAADILLSMANRYDPDRFDRRSYDVIVLLSNLSSYVTEPHADFIGDRLRRMLIACEQANERRAAMQIRLQLAFELYMRERYSEFEPIARDLLTQLRDVLLPRAESNLWFALAVIDADRGEYNRALETLDRCIELRWQTRSISMWQLALISRALILKGARRDDEAAQTTGMIRDDALRNRRHHRRFLLDVCHMILQARKGAGVIDAQEIDRLRDTGHAEAYPAVEKRLLEVRIETLLHAPTADPDEAEGVALAALDLEAVHALDRELIVTAAAAVARALSGTRNGRRRRMTAIVDALMEKVSAALDVWRDSAPALLRHYLPILRQHVFTLLPESARRALGDDLESLAQEEGIYDANLVAFGRLRVLGKDGSERGGRHFGTQKSDSKPRKLLAALVSGAVFGRRLTRERLVDMVWGESTSDESATNLFHVTLSGIRQVIGEAVDFDGATYALHPGRLHIDALQFLRLLEESRAAERDGVTYRACDLLVEACGLYRGEFLEGIYDEWCEGAREDLRARARAARLRLADLAIMRGEHDTARRTIQEMLETDPADEEAMCLSLRLLEAEGDRVRAIREYEEFSDRLQREYHVGPSRRLRELRQALETA